MRNNTKLQEKIFLLSLVALIVFGTLFSINTWTTSLKTTDEEAKYIATIGEIFLNGEAFKKLTGTEEDLGTVSYESIKLRMLNFIGIQKGIRFAYIYTLRDDKVYFMVDSEPADSEDCSPPGEEYTDATDMDKKPFIDGQTLITKPLTDKWGTWVSVLVPMKDVDTGKTIAVFGLDYPAITWTVQAQHNTTQAVVIVLFLILILIGFYIIFRKNQILKQEQIKLEIANIEIEKAQKSAEAATKSKSEFLANMSHEIRTPMNAIIGFSGLVRKTDMTPKQNDYINKIDSSAKSLLGIVNDILDFSKIEAGKLEMESVDFRLDDVINNISSMISVKASEKNVELINNIASGVPCALIGDPLRLGQILSNLATNAVKFTEKGHILINSELIEKDDVRCKIKFSIKDTGIGMTEEQINKLFSAFSQADSSITRKFGGTGLGLTITKRLVEMMNGELFVESKFNVGSTFTFIVEFKRQSLEKENRVVDIEQLHDLKVLIVDDNEMSREILKEQLSSFGINAYTVDSGNKAILELKQKNAGESYDLVLMDWRMPGMDGIETAKIIFEDKSIGRMPMTIMVTAFGREEVVKRAEKIGINAFLMKPVNQSLLLDTILNVLEMDNIKVLTSTPEKEEIDPLNNGINGARALLVEDNVLNQEVATEILKSLGVIVEIAKDGKEAVAAVNAVEVSYYDLILMDLQMPIMGGFEATQLIRANEKFKNLPIIAMTAHAMQGAKEECIAVGMNDYVSKPIDPEQLFDVMKKWIKPSVASEQQTIINTEVADEQKTEIELPNSMSGINIEAGLKRLSGNRTLYKKLLINFADGYSNSSQDIRKAIEQSDPEVAMSMAHTIKGIAGNISAYDIQNISFELETAILKNDKEKYNALLSLLDNALESYVRLVKGLTVAEKSEDSNCKKGVVLSEVEPLVQKLAQLIWEDNVDSEHCLEQLRKSIGNSEYEEEIKILAKCIDSFDFESAKEPLRKMANEMNISLGGI